MFLELFDEVDLPSSVYEIIDIDTSELSGQYIQNYAGAAVENLSACMNLFNNLQYGLQETKGNLPQQISEQVGTKIICKQLVDNNICLQVFNDTMGLIDSIIVDGTNITINQLKNILRLTSGNVGGAVLGSITDNFSDCMTLLNHAISQIGITITTCTNFLTTVSQIMQIVFNKCSLWIKNNNTKNAALKQIYDLLDEYVDIYNQNVDILNSVFYQDEKYSLIKVEEGEYNLINSSSPVVICLNGNNVETRNIGGCN